MRFTKKVISHCNLWECNCGRVVDQTDRQTDQETVKPDALQRSFGDEGLYIRWSIGSLLVRPCKPWLAFRLGGGGGCLGPWESKTSISGGESPLLFAHHHHHRHCHATGMFSAEQDTSPHT